MAGEHATGLLRVDVAVVGAGAAGVYAALVAAEEGARVVLVSRSPLTASASYWAQGGIAAALAGDDAPEHHFADTIAAGRGAGRESTARVLCAESPARVRELERAGMSFDLDERGELALGLEGGHSRRRVVHAGGSETGRRLTAALCERVEVDERIEILEETTGSALWLSGGRCVGLVADRGPSAQGRVAVLARGTIVATGGGAALWARTTNPRGAIGAGLTLAHAAGAALADLELVQFHPTALVASDALDGFLLTEALRGEGALLLDPAGERFVDELAPRDEVALAIEGVLQRGADRGVVSLDLRRLDLERFPTVASTLQQAGIDPRREPVPVAPAAHYTMGGIATDLEGRSSVPGLYAVGECACTGLHGANRLASNSLAECLVFGRRAGRAALDEPAVRGDPGPSPAGGPSPAPPPATRRALWRLAGLERRAEGLRELSCDTLPLARLIARSALLRAESRGAHQRSDRPRTDPALDHLHAVVAADDQPAWERWN